MLYFRGHIAAAYTYLQDIDLFVVATIPVLILLVFLSFFTDIRYVMSEEPSFVVERYAFIWVANYAQRGHPFRLSGTAIPFLAVRSTAIV